MELNIIHNLDALSGLRLLPDESIDCIVTSPPYWQMRDYGIGSIVWGGDESCVHEFDEKGYCSICGAWLGQLGLEPTRDDYIHHLILIFDQCKRVLKPQGTLWVNLGDTYANPRKYSLKANPQTISRGNNRNYVVGKKSTANDYIRGKSLCNIPNAFADAMIHKGWILRNEIIWHKPACMPASVKDRFTVDFEKVLFFVKSETYFFNQQFEPYATSTPERYLLPYNVSGKGETYRVISGKPEGIKTINPQGRNMRCVWKVAYEPSGEAHFAMYPSKLVETPIKAGCPEGGVVLDPFMGGGTTAVVAQRLGRKYIGFEPNAEYIDICHRRLSKLSKD